MKPKLSLLICALFACAAARSEDGVALLPQTIVLKGTEARQSLLVERVRGGQFTGQISEDIEFVSSDPAIVAVENGVALPKGNGSATITVKSKLGTAQAKVTVSGLDQPFQWSFRNHVQPVLMRTGCSTGACHGAAAGKNGFRLSLRGYDDEGDYRAITRHALGRRVIPSDPGRSLLMTKATGAVPHKGGQRFDTDSLEYRVVSEWIASGMSGPSSNDPRIEKIEILPQNAVLKAGTNQQLIVRAYFSDGQIQDVTRWARYTSAVASVATVDDSGRVSVVGTGEGAITAWYLSRIAIGTVSVPNEKPQPPEVFTQAKRRNFIDELVLEKLQSLNIPPSPKCNDGDFLRRAYIDTIGILPTADETRAFLADTSPTKRDELIDKLLKRPEFVDYWSYKWSDLLLVNSEKLNPQAMWSYYNWIRRNVAANTPWDVMVRDLMTAKGSTLENGGGNFFVLHEDPKVLAETASVAFMGLAINCAQCHNHPMEKWTNDQYYAMANLFARVRTKNAPGDGNRIVYSATEGDLVQPLTGKPQPPQPLDGKVMDINSPADRREHLAEWLVSRDNPYFTRAITNRVWASFFGTGLVEAVDDLRVTNPPSNEKLLAATAKFLADNKFNLQSLMRAILQSETYQRSSETLPENKVDTRFYSRFYPRRIMAEVLLDALSNVTGSPTAFANYPKGWRAMQLPDSNVNSYFLKSFGRPNRLITCECERTIEPSMAQVLHISNGDTLNKKLEDSSNRISQWISTKAPHEKVIEDLYLSALARYPTENEKAKLLKMLAAEGAEVRPLLEDLYWSVLSSKEFLFNH
ncbi:MAG TPA: DUF1549 domain-containing protein [Planctomycetota bacterium]|nr:DUF1549 domain-containing protein [Planctomycetota bacterium]